MFDFIAKLFGQKQSEDFPEATPAKGKSKMSLEQQMDLMKKIVSPPAEGILPIDISRVEKIVKERIPGELGIHAPANFPVLYFDLEYIYSRFYDFILFRDLIGKNIVALGGGFSSGKSSFLNTLLGDSKILPTSVKPSTSVPSYVIRGARDEASAINAFEAKLDLDFMEIRSIAHGFGKSKDGEITLGHLLRSVFIATPQHPYSNIAFLDTPGYSKADSVDYSAKTDEKIAFSQLNASNYILWFIDAKVGTITADDIEFISRLDKDIPKLIIINKVDTIPNPQVLAEMKAGIKVALNAKGIQYVDILAYSRKETVECDREAIKGYLQKLDQGRTQYDFAYDFKKLFLSCKSYYESELEEEKNQLSRLNRAQTLTENPEIEDLLYRLILRTKAKIEEIKESKERLKTIQQDFFTEIKRIADAVNIKMPEPSEIELLGEKIHDPLEILDSL